MTPTLVKLALTPLLVVAVTLISRRWGHVAGGAVAGLPLTSGPVSVLLALEQGRAFAAEAAAGTTLGMVSMGAFCASYARTATRSRWPASALAGMAAFAASTALLSPLRPGLGLAFGAACLGLGAGLALLPRPGRSDAAATAPPWDLPVRAATTTGIVLALTALAPALGPALSGLVSPVPVVTLILAAFAQRAQGPAAVAGVLRGMIVGSFAFPVFFVVVGVGLPRWGLLATYGVASAAAVATNLLLLRAAGRGAP